MTKGQMIKELKNIGVRRGINSLGNEVSLEHLKFADVVNLYFQYFDSIENKN